MLTLRQIEIIRAIMLAGTVKGAAEMLGVSAPGISRVMKHTEEQLGIKLFSRSHGRFAPTAEALDIFNQINEVFSKVEDLQYLIEKLKRGESRVFSFASAPSISQHILPRAVRRLQTRFPDLRMNINVLKIEETIDYLLLKKGELVAMSYKIDHPGLISHLLATGSLVALVPSGHVLADSTVISLAKLIKYPLIGIDPDDPYGKILASAFIENGLKFELSIQARFVQTVCRLVANNLGVAVIDEFSVATLDLPGITVLPIKETTTFKTYGVVNAQVPRSNFADELLGFLKLEMQKAVKNRQLR
jgi:DNA-binding transcriptional LysR family regulator